MRFLGLRKKISRSANVIIRTQAGGAKRLFRLLDLRGELQLHLPSLFLCYTQDPCRTAFLGLFVFLNGILSYRIGTHNLIPLLLFQANLGENFKIKDGLVSPLILFKGGQFFHTVPLIKGFKGVVGRAAGAYLSLLRTDLQLRISYARIKRNLILALDLDTLVTAGRVCNILHYESKDGKAGIRRLKGFKPIVRGIAMNPVDHPNGGRTPGGKVYRSFSNKIARSALKTRSKYRIYNSYILRA